MAAKTLKEVFDRIRLVEEKFDLVNFKTGGVFIWPVMRLRVIRAIAESTGIFAATPKQPSIFDLGSNFDAAKSQAIFKSIMTGKSKSEFAVIPFLRRDAQGEDVFTKRVVTSLKDAFVFGVGAADAESDKLSIDYIAKEFEKRFRRRAMLVSQLAIRRWHGRHWREAILDLEVMTGADLSKYRSLPKWMMVEFHAQRIGFKALFKKLGVRALFYVNAYNSAYIAGAKEAGVWVVEPQHGLLSEFHSTLAWPGTGFVDYQPDEVLVWGQYWADATKFAGNVQTSIIGWAPTVSREDALNRKAGTVAFVSQPEHANMIAKLAVEAAKSHPELRFILKLHPKDSQPKFALPENLQLAGPKVNAQILGTRCEHVIGVSSMALVEAAALGAKVSLIDLPGREHLDALVKIGAMNVISGLFNFEAALQAAKVFANFRFLFAPELSDEEFANILNGSTR